jgi:hypothetical protein
VVQLVVEWLDHLRDHAVGGRVTSLVGMTASAVADPVAREFLRSADPVLARLVDARPVVAAAAS